MSLTSLPNEVLEILLSYLDGVSTLKLGSTCSFLHQMTSQARVWDSLYKRTRITVVSREVEQLAGGDRKAAFFLCHRLRRNWGSGNMKETVLVKGGLHYEHHMDASDFYAAMWGRQESKSSDLFTLNICNLDGEERNVTTVPLETEIKLGIVATYVLDDYIVLLSGDNMHGMKDMIVISIRENRFLYSKKNVYDCRNFMRSQIMDTSNFANNIVSFRQKTIILYKVTENDVDVITLEVEEHGLLQYCKFFAWDKTYLAHPFQAMPSNPREFDAYVEHRVFCWEQETWQRKCLKMKGRSHEIMLSLAVHHGKLYSAQATTIRVWDINTETLLKMSQLNLPIPVDPSFPNSFLFTDKIGLYLQPQLELVVGMVTGHLGNRAIYTIAIFDFDWKLVANFNIPPEKDLQNLELHLIGPRVIVLYNDNHYSVVDLEILDQKQQGIQPDVTGIQRGSVISFPLGSSQKKGRLVSQSLMEQNRDPETFTLRKFENISQFNVVINQTDDRNIEEIIQNFNFL